LPLRDDAVRSDATVPDEKRMKEVDGAYGPAEDMAPFLPYRSTEEASFISGAVFTVTGNGRVTLYSDLEPPPRSRRTARRGASTS
jgi:hypothetical protein